MTQIVKSRFKRPAIVNVVNTEMTVPALEFVDHSAEPIKHIEDIETISNYLIREGRLKDNLLFIMGINFGLRCSDLVQLRYGDIINEELEYRDPIWVRERKTARKRTGQNKNKNENTNELATEYKLKNPRALYVNDAVADAFERYCGDRDIDLNDYLFPGRNGTPMCYSNVYDKFTRLIQKDLKMNIHASTHFMRKTFAYHFIMNADDRNRAIEYLQECFNHTSPLITLRYAGITNDEIRGTIMKMNLGGSRFIDVNAKVLYSYEFNGRTCQVLDLASAE